MNNEQFQHKLAQTKEINPPEFVWDNISQHLDNKRKRHVIWIWLLISGILTGAVVTAYFYFTDKQEITVNVEDKTPSTKKTIVDVKDVAKSGLEQHGENAEQKPSLSTTEVQNAKASMVANPKSFSRPYLKTKTKFTEHRHQNAEKIVSENRVEDQADLVTSKNEKVEIAALSENLLDAINSITNNEIKWKDDIICHDFRIRKRKNYFVEAGLQLGRPRKTISGSDAEKPLLDLRNQTERAWYSWGAYGKIGMYLNKGLYASTGIEYLQSKELFILEKEAITKMIINFDPNTGLPTDTSFVTGTLVNKGEIRYSALELPLSVGYLSGRKKWNFGAEVSARLNLKFSATGKTYNQNLMVSRIENEADMYKSTIGLSLKGSLMVGYNVSRKTTLLVKPYFIWQAKPVNADGNPLKTNLNNVGVELGIRRDF